MKFFKGSNDQMFKSIFEDIKNRDLLEALIKEVTDKDIHVERILVPEQKKNNIHVKGKTLDMLCKIDGMEVNIEVNTSNYYSLHRRNAAYIFTRYSDNLEVGDSYNKMPHFIQINLTSPTIIDIPLCSCYSLYDKSNDIEFIDNLLIYEINLKKAKESCYNNKKYNLISLLDCDNDELKDSYGDKMMDKLKNEINRLNQDKEFVEFLSSETEERLLTNTLKEDIFNEGHESGLKDGFLENQRLVVKNMLKENMNIKMISKITGLSIDEINNIKKES